MSISAIIVAAGSGQRLGGGTPKQFRRLAGRPILAHAARRLASHPAIRDIRVVVSEGQEQAAQAALEGIAVGELVRGGATRADSVQAGLAKVSGDAVLVHDAARPFCPHDVIDRLIAALEFHEGAAPVLQVSDTLARSTGDLGEAIDRSGLVRVQTPQAARTDALRQAYAAWDGTEAPTDETSVLRAAGMRVATVEGAVELDKITTGEDFARAERWLAGIMVPRTGMGFDVHAFGGDGPVMLGGIAIPHDRGLAGHSDADVVLHAITDALLGAAGLGDIGDHFPPSDPQWKGAASELFLAHAATLVRDQGAIIDAVDCTVIAEAPRIGPHRVAMRERIATILGLDPGRISVKATTTERLGFTGRGEGIAAQAVANIRMGWNA
ncbi:MAG: bifunctional 2-C-methyl-D-erythritol 4-phosphate cytidylyltransferase/2-C-methyl-D-erythritol 2,4-cyclodiphosphate synthase [Sphingomicrobium sp.]